MKELNYASLTKIILIGINVYEDKALQILESPENDAHKLYSALINPRAYAIPKENILLLTKPAMGQSITRALFLEQVKVVLAKLSEEDNLIFYFAGHGDKDAQGFYLCFQDTRVGALPLTALSNMAIDEVFGAVETRGMLFILDCCKSAALAENAPAIFRKAGKSQFKLLMSASRDEQNSWEMPGGKGTLFTNHLFEVLNRDVVVGKDPSFVTFTDLFEYLAAKVAEDLESKYPNLGKQEPVFAGSYSRDPLLFANPALPLIQVRDKIRRYSREYVVRRTKKLLISLAVFICFVLGIYYTWLDKLEYTDLGQNGHIMIYKGHPKYNAFGFPHLIWETNLYLNDVMAGSPLKRKETLFSPLGQPITPVLIQQLTPVYRALFLVWSDKKSAAKEVLRDFLEANIQSEAAQNDLILAVSLYSTLADSSDGPLFQRISELGRIEASTSAAQVLSLDFDRNYPLLKRLQVTESNEVTTAVLRTLYRYPGLRNDSISDYLAGLCANEHYFSQQPSALASDILLAAIASAKKLNITTLLSLLKNIHDYDQIRSIALYAKYIGIGSGLTDSVARLLNNYASHLQDFKNWSDINHFLFFLSYTDPPRCLPVFLKCYNFKADYFKQYAAAAIAHNCPDIPIHSDRSDVLVELAKAGRLPADTLAWYGKRFMEMDDLINMIRACGYSNNPWSVGYLRRLAQNRDAYISQSAIEALIALKAPAADYEALLSTNYAEVLSATLKWIATTDSIRAIQLIFDRLGDSKLFQEAAISLLSRYQLSESQYSILYKSLSGDVYERTVAASILGTKAGPGELTNLINNPDPVIRSAAVKYLLINPLMRSSFDTAHFTTRFPDFTTEAIKAQKKTIRWIDGLLGKVPENYKDPVLELLLRANRGDEPLELYLEKSVMMRKNSYHFVFKE